MCIRVRVKFLGFRKDVAEIMNQADIFALISNWEGLPCTIIEAMCGGIPVIASDVGGVKEVVADGETGYVVPRSNRAILTEKLSKLATNQKLRLQMGLAGRQRYESQFTFKQMYQKTLNTYQEVMKSTQ